MSLEGKYAIVAAGAKNLGGLISKELARAGAAGVAVHYNSASSEAAADETVAAIQATGAKTVKFQGDLTKPENITAFYNAALSEFGSLDIAVNTVGQVIRKPILEITEADYDEIFDKNSKAAFFFIKEAAEKLNDGGSITTIITSLLAFYTDGYAIYGGSKSPVVEFTKAASKELGSRQISVNAIAPGPMDTPFLYPQENDGRVEWLKSTTPLGRLTEITDVASSVVFLAGPGKWYTGQVFYPNGGFATKG
ncbi:SDR family oxidoreductase [Segniliparus rugosus]|uniref:Short-chain dehydrogenase n=1 Tax=Segniliparus rugosus (strain ATCC BAA-974 / DSM 45345 / CCUG 50838 / CIP 108380 / JCM 13579 / CDC 945) TaxID=679197 RepID=E5XQA3_SEGRC|nr:SDR family oxidoreductase [Segniliparus rugosus]EFV13465.1 hypothetical protein HMPREF9336_01675 [Segniliparus rugosus ATCC BAA-974]